MTPFSYGNNREKTGVEPYSPEKMYIGWPSPVPEIHHDYLSCFFSTTIHEVFYLFHKKGS
tara:strand:+ start:95 stop:274 length:180 start_codon:yes stop_codon:yes gene_type:complete